MNANDIQTEELTAAIRAIQDRVRARHVNGSLGAGGVIAPDLMALVHARDAADAKVAAIGRVNPRSGGLVNSVIQGFKKLVSRALDWHVREQVEFNRAVMQCVQSTLEGFEQTNRSLSQTVAYINGEVSAVRSEIESVRAEVEATNHIVRTEVSELKDVRVHWAQWRQGWEEKLNRSEVYMLRTISELNASFQHRATLTEDSFRKAMLEQNGAFRNLLEVNAIEVQRRLWEDLRNVRADFEKLIFNELRVVRQRGVTQGPAVGGAGGAVTTASSATTSVDIDWLKFADRFRGSEERVRAGQSLYLAAFAGAVDVLDIGCGRGEFLEAARDAGIGAHGIDLSDESVALCRGKGLNAEVADLFAYLQALPDKSLGGVYCSQVIEHLAAAALPEMIRLISAKIRPGSAVAFETPNPECLAIYATHFYLDPTHTRPVPAPLLVFYLEENGFGQFDVQFLSPAVDTMPSLAELPEEFRRTFFGGMDYAIIARKL